MRINIFRNPHIDAQVGYLIDSMVDARRKETEKYWRKTIAQEISMQYYSGASIEDIIRRVYEGT